MAERLGIECRIVACPVPTGHWEFVLVNDGSATLDSVVLCRVAYEWGGYGHSDPTNVTVSNLAPGASEKIWDDNGDGVEGRMDLQLVVRVGETKADLLFEFPILYKKDDLPMVEPLGRRGWEEGRLA